MATVNETIYTGRKFRKLIDRVGHVWARYSFWSKAGDTECNDGQTVETKVGAVKGITTDLNTTQVGYAADMTTVAELNNNINLYVGDDKKLHFVNGSGADSVIPFNSGKLDVNMGSPNGYNTDDQSYAITYDVSNYKTLRVCNFTTSETQNNYRFYVEDITNNKVIIGTKGTWYYGSDIRTWDKTVDISNCEKIRIEMVVYRGRSLICRVLAE